MKDEKYHKVRDHCHYTGEYRGATSSTGNLEQSVLKEIPIPFHKGCNYDDHFVIKELAEEFKEQFTCLEENTEKYITSTVPMEKEVTGIYKNREELQKIYLTYCNLLIAEDLWKAHYQILSIKGKYRHHDENVKFVESRTKYATIFVNRIFNGRIQMFML